MAETLVQECHAEQQPKRIQKRVSRSNRATNHLYSTTLTMTNISGVMTSLIFSMQWIPLPRRLLLQRKKSELCFYHCWQQWLLVLVLAQYRPKHGDC